jgi:hypothetical protein
MALTGADAMRTGASGDGGGARPGILETGRPGVFAVGDVRSGSVKRVASAVGEGAIAVRLVHQHLDKSAPPVRESPPAPAPGSARADRRRRPRRAPRREDARPPLGTRTVVLGMIAAPELASEVAEELAEALPALLSERVSDRVRWTVPLVHDQLTHGAAGGVEMVDAVRERMLREGWDLAVCITDLPLRIGSRPVVADASATHGVAVIALPTLGARRLFERARDVVLRIVDGMVGERLEPGRHDAGRRERVGRRLVELAARPEADGSAAEAGRMRLLTGVVRGNLQLLLGMLRANRPWRLVAGLSKLLIGALSTGAIALVNTTIWQLADAMGWQRAALLSGMSVIALGVVLMTAHDLWETAPAGSAVPTTLFNLVTALTVAFGVITLYVALLALTTLGAAFVLDPRVLEEILGHPAGVADYVTLAWAASTVATLGVALGSALESDVEVRQAAYGYWPDRSGERPPGDSPSRDSG